MDYLSRLLSQLSTDGSFQFHPKCKRVKVTNLLFVVDLVLFCKADETSVSKLHEVFVKFYNASGLVANARKSCVYLAGV